MNSNKPDYPSRVADQFVVRFPNGMRDRIREASETNGRSMNAEIVARLQASFDERTPPVDERMVEVGKTLVEFLICHMDTPTEQLPDGLRSFVRRAGPTGRLIFDEAAPSTAKNSRSSE